MKRLKITESQAKMISNRTNNKTLKVSKEQYKMLQEMEMRELSTEDVIAGKSVPKNSIPSNKVTKNFSKSLDSGVKKEIGKLYEDFINEVYGLNESSDSKYGKLISLMEVAGLIENGRLKKEAFKNDKNRLKEIMSKVLSEIENGCNEYRAMENMENMINEYDDYMNTSDAPWNQPDAPEEEEEDCIEASQYPLKMVYSNEEEDGVVVFHMEGKAFVHFDAYNSGEEVNDYCGQSQVGDFDAERSNNFINDKFVNGKLKVGKDPFKHILAIVTPRNLREIKKYYGNDEALMKSLVPMSETTTASSSGSFVAPLSTSKKFESNLDDELQETTTTTSVGGDSGTFAYDAPAGDGSDFWNAGNKQNKKKVNENAKTDTQYPGGGFVELDDCTKLNNNKVSQNGGCNQGDSGVVKTKGSINSVISESIFAEIAKKTGRSIKEVKAIIKRNK